MALACHSTAGTSSRPPAPSTACTSTTRVARLQDSRFQDRDVRDISQYIRLGPLGLAFESPGRSVVLIDEIDKADLEFPNDLLHELDAMRFVIAETGREVVARERPILVITSNAEKELPDAFLRRTVFHCIEFPEEERLRAICRVHHPDVEERLLAAALRRFMELRAVRDMRKRPSTSELVDWIAGLRVAGIDPERLERSLPFLGVLVKDETDIGRVTRAAEARAGAGGAKTQGDDGRRWGRS